MKKLILLFGIIFTSLLFPQRNDSTKKIILKKIDTEIKIDGVIDTIWNVADSATNYFQLQPYYNEKPRWPTVAKLLTSDDALYCLIICYEDKNYIKPETLAC